MGVNGKLACMKSATRGTRAPGRAEARNALAANLKWWRKRRRLSVKALGMISHVPSSLIRAIEAGQQFDAVLLGTVQALAQGLNLAVAALLADERAVPRQKARRRP